MKRPLGPAGELAVMFVACLLLIIVASLILCNSSRGAASGNLLTRSDLQVDFYNMISYDSTNTRWSPAIVRKWLNKSMKFVQRTCKCNTEMDTIRMNPDSMFYAAPSGAADGGVLEIQKIVNGNLINMTKRPSTDFGKLDLVEGEVFAVRNDTIMIWPKPDQDLLMYVTYWKIQPDMDYDSTEVFLPEQYRSLVTMYAYGLYMLARDDYASYKEIRDDVLQEIYLMNAAPSENIQNFGVDSAQ